VRSSRTTSLRHCRRATHRASLFLPFACAAILLAVPVERAVAGKPGPSPFTGSYEGQVGSFVTLDIASDGKISGTWFKLFGGGTVSGRITDAGDMHLTFSPARGARKGRQGVSHATAVASLDADGNLVGLWLWDSVDEPFPFELTRIAAD